MNDPDYAAILRRDLMSFIERSFYELNPQTELLRAPHLELIAAKLEACRRGKINRLIVTLPPRQLNPIAPRSPSPPGISHTTLLRTSSVRVTVRTSPINSPATAGVS
jgi:hypothetical protein